ncbi:hypothetical protein [Coleofasciculus sp.]|uniref:hypothetical protein n=1 Tax=Coleofasciculus sp. TaxID=3100458 RepID=UPI0039F970FB
MLTEGNLDFVPEWKHLEISLDELNQMLMSGEITPEIEQRIGEEDTQWLRKWLRRFRAGEAVCEHAPL